MILPDIPILNTALAIVVSWALFALFCSYILEAFIQIIGERGKFMKDYLYKQLMDNINGINWADRIYSHGSIDLLSRDPKKPSNEISPKLFVETLLEVVGNSLIVQSNIRTLNAQGIVVAYQSALLRNFKYATLVLNQSDLSALFRQAMQYAELHAATGPGGAINEVALHNYLTEYLEKWFGEFTQRLTLWYKKLTRQRLFYLGVIIAFAINVDSIELFEFFESNPQAAAKVVRFYEEHPSLHTDAAALAQVQATLAAVPAETQQIDTLKEQAMALLQLKSSEAQQQLTKELDTLISKTMLPVGLKHSIVFKPPYQQHIVNWGTTLLKILGVLISGFAASFGAPFWFDLLKKVTKPKPDNAVL
ncbi:hypothetical protein [Dyadobacter sp. Leaf189]|uniref:hypothetical protein n=1 Tax=Dyadobacter sp. Leaf189 TaxID=1736295 RepID=UPI0006FA2B1A|nr:hypothetical protein [Dyadobacter sp. Leaf189]KQS33866.1 hypothetical protein ASG33_07435 [Dyadobacter sp. Leaf189]